MVYHMSFPRVQGFLHSINPTQACVAASTSAAQQGTSMIIEALALSPMFKWCSIANLSYYQMAQKVYRCFCNSRRLEMLHQMNSCLWIMDNGSGTKQNTRIQDMLRWTDR